MTLPFPQDPETQRLVDGYKGAQETRRAASAAVADANNAERQAQHERDRWEKALAEHMDGQRAAVWRAARDE